MRKVLIAGGAGFIGSNLTRLLQSKGAEVTVVDDFLTGRPENLPDGTPCIEMDCADPQYLERFKDHDWDLVVHFAGASSAPLFDDAPMRLSQAFTAFQNSLEIARTCDSKVAFASTSSFYARCPKPYREDMHLEPHTLYECSKYSMEQQATAYAAMYGLDIVAFRFFSVYGPHERGKGRFANIVSQFYWSLKAGKAPVVYGDGSQTRDFTHVSDLIQGIMLALEDADGFDVYNIGTGVEHTFNQVIEKLNSAMGTDVQAQYVPNPVRNYVHETLADNSKLRGLGWQATVDLDEGIRRLVEADEPVDDELLTRIAS